MSFIVPVNAKFNATSLFSNLGHSTPGVSNSSMFSLIRIHWFFCVTPGLFSTCKDVFLAILFINDDFPTLGIPRTITLIFLPTLPFSACFCNSLFIIFSISLVTLSIPLPVFASVSNAVIPFSLKCSTHSLFCFSSDKSLLFNTIIFFFPFVISAISGFWLDIGILLSSNSTTTSISFKLSIICFLVFAMCPGYQLMLVLFSFIWINSFICNINIWLWCLFNIKIF